MMDVVQISVIYTEFSPALKVIALPEYAIEGNDDFVENN
jgi:hypothetical protein